MESDCLELVKSKLLAGDKIITCLRVSLIDEWVKTTRFLALVDHHHDRGLTEHALFLFNTRQSPPTAPEDLDLEYILPIDHEFNCEIDTPNLADKNSDVYIRIRAHKLKLLVELPFGSKTNSLVSDILHVREVISKHRGPAPSFSWINDYNHQYFSSLFGSGLSIKDNSTSSDSALINDNQHTSEKPISIEGMTSTSIMQGTKPIPARESVVRHQMSMQEDSYTDIQHVKIFCGTWNVNGQPASVLLNEWLSVDDEPPDVYAVGFQELDLSKEAFLFNDTPREEEWTIAVINGLHPKAKFKKVKSIRLVGMLLLIFVQDKYAAYVREVAAETVGTGIMGKMGNKGGVAVRLEMHSSTICFVNSHLAAHVEEYERRNQDYDEICSRLCFTSFMPPKFIKDHDLVFWIGDLNYRITDMDPDTAKNMITKKQYSSVLEKDQLLIQRDKLRVFVGYKEGDINFSPTYKYDPGTDDWDSSEKNRAPAWCDRIMWKGDHITQLTYRSHPILKISDHKPVSSVFNVGVKVIDAIKYRKIYEDVMKKLDKLENEFLPQVTVETNEIIFDTVKVFETQKKYFSIANTGQVPVQFEFINKLNEKNFCKAWLTVSPYLNFIMPGESCQVELEVHVSKETAHRLHSGQDQLYDILVLHLEGGKDIFITVSGEYQRSCFGASINALIGMKLPISQMAVGKLVELESKCDVSSTDETYGIPKELWFMVDYIYNNGLDSEGLFFIPSIHPDILTIRDCLDNGEPENINCSVHSVAEAMLLLLECFPEPVIPFSFTSQCLEVSENYMLCKQVLNKIPPHHRNVFLYVCAFLKEVLAHPSNGQDPKTLATLFGEILLRDPVTKKQDKSKMKLEVKKANFVYHFIAGNDNNDS